MHDYLLGNFSPLFAYDYTAKLETMLDDIAAGKLSEVAALNDFWTEFQPLLRGATAELKSIQSQKPPAEKTGESCPKCGAELVKRMGKNGEFVGCSAFPKCRYTANYDHQPINIQPKK